MSHESSPGSVYEQKSLFKLPHERPDDVSDAEWEEHTAKRSSGYYNRIEDWLNSSPERVSRFEKVTDAPVVTPETHNIPATVSSESVEPAPPSHSSDQAEKQDYIPLNFTPETQYTSRTGDLVVRAAQRVNSFLERNNRLKHDAIRKIGHVGLMAKKLWLVDVPTAALNLGMLAGEKVEDGKDILADRRDKVQAGLADTALFLGSVSRPNEHISMWRQSRAERKAEKALSKLDKADNKVISVEQSREKRRAKAIQKKEAANKKIQQRAEARELRHAA